MKFLPVIFLTAIFFACKSDKKVQAKIFERKEIDSLQILIKYKYSVNNQQYVDSATIKNVALPNDTITVNLANNPSESTPDL
jgi:hypothetical protein